MKEENKIKTKIGVGSGMTENVGDTEDNTRGVIIRMKRKEVMGSIKDM